MLGQIPDDDNAKLNEEKKQMLNLYSFIYTILMNSFPEFMFNMTLGIPEIIESLQTGDNEKFYSSITEFLKMPLNNIIYIYYDLLFFY